METKEWWSHRPQWVVPSILTIFFLVFIDLVIDPIGGSVADLSDSVWWAVLPWAVIVALWILFFRRLTKGRAETQE